MSEKLKQCPFCKGEFAFDFEAKNFRCGTCGATVLPDPYARTVNTRPIEDDLRKRIAELEGAYIKADDMLDDVILERAIEIGGLKKRIAELTECIGSQMADVYTLKARIAELREDNATLGDSNAWIKQNYEDLERDYGVMYDKMCARIDKLTAENKVLEDACEILRKENRRLFSQVFSDGKPELNVCEVCGGDGTVLLAGGYKGPVIATAKCIYCNGTGRVNKESEE